MKQAIASLIFTVAVASGQAKLTISADTTTLAPGGKAKLSVKQGTATPTATWTADTEGLSATQGSSVVYTAPAQDGKLTPTGSVMVTAKLADGTTATIELNIHAPGSWESRSIVGFSQSAASSSDPRQAFFLDFFIERGLDKVSAVDAKVTLWGNIRLASVPQQINAPVSALTKDLGTAAKALQLNQLVQSAEFLTGLEWRLPWSPSDASTKRDIGLIVQYGETGPLQPKDTLQLFALPDSTSAQYSSFVHSYGAPPTGTQYVGFVSPDRGSFFKQYGFGFRVSTFSLSDPETPPATYSFTVGQDQTVTGGRYQGLVGKIDVFYPLPISIGNPDFKFIYLFGTVNTRFSSRPVQADPLILAPAPSTVNGYDNNVMLVTSPSNRDTYRIGIGLDALSLLKKLKVSTK
jgi:hypothetical protein